MCGAWINIEGPVCGVLVFGFRHSIREGGVRSCVEGNGSISSGALLLFQSLYDTTKAGMMTFAASEPSALLFAACGVVAGVTAQTVVYPLDVLRRRMQTVTHTDGASLSVRGALVDLIQTAGPRGLFAGIVPAWLRVAPAAAVSLLVRDAVLGRLSK